MGKKSYGHGLCGGKKVEKDKPCVGGKIKEKEYKSKKAYGYHSCGGKKVEKDKPCVREYKKSENIKHISFNEYYVKELGASKNWIPSNPGSKQDLFDYLNFLIKKKGVVIDNLREKLLVSLKEKLNTEQNRNLKELIEISKGNIERIHGNTSGIDELGFINLYFGGKSTYKNLSETTVYSILECTLINLYKETKKNAKY